jgi:alpha-galactosidase
VKQPKSLKITLIGAGSMSFAPLTIRDILLNPNLNSVPLEICLMDILEAPLKVSEAYAREVTKVLGRSAVISATTNLEAALQDANFVVTAIEVDRYFYWSQDFHIPRKYGSSQIYGENGGPGGMFHTLRNIPPMLEIAHAMERICPDTWLINYTNPEAKLVEAVTRLTKIQCVGLCHGIGMGLEQLSGLLNLPMEELDVVACGLNHFGWFQSIKSKKTGADLYPLLREKERQANWLSNWDEIALSRLMLRIYGLYPYPGANHIGEYIRWSDGYLAGALMQYFYDPVTEDPWKSHKLPDFVYSAASLREKPLFEPPKSEAEQQVYENRFELKAEDLKPSHEVGVQIIESIAFDIPRDLLAVNLPNTGCIPGLPEGMAVELPAHVDGTGIHARQMEPLPDAVTEMIRVQGVIHKLIIDAYVEQSRNKLLQAVLLDPTVGAYNNMVAMINEICEVQKDILPPLHW